jgi:hypothetical protein
MSCLEKLGAYLHASGVPFEVQHQAFAYAAYEIAACEHNSASRMTKVVMVVADGALAILVIPSSHKVAEAATTAPFDVQDVRLASEEEAQ